VPQHKVASLPPEINIVAVVSISCDGLISFYDLHPIIVPILEMMQVIIFDPVVIFDPVGTFDPVVTSVIAGCDSLDTALRTINRRSHRPMAGVRPLLLRQ
jgi:hypothetical protein